MSFFTQIFQQLQYFPERTVKFSVTFGALLLVKGEGVVTLESVCFITNFSPIAPRVVGVLSTGICWRIRRPCIKSSPLCKGQLRTL